MLTGENALVVLTQYAKRADFDNIVRDFSVVSSFMLELNAWKNT